MEDLMANPQSPAEVKLHSLVSRVLSLDEEGFGLDNNFMQLGGDSISAMRLASNARAEGLPLTVTDILTKNHIGDLLDAQESSVPQPEHQKSCFAHIKVDDPRSFVQNELIPQIEMGNRNLVDVLPVTDMQSTYLRENLEVPRQSWYYHYVDLAHNLDEARLIQSCRELVAQCDIYRTVFVRSNGNFFQAIFDTWEPTVQIFDGPDTIEAGFEHAVKAEFGVPVSLGAPLLQFKLIRAQDSRVRLVFSTSHAIYDAISMSQTMQTLAELYDGLVSHSPAFTRYLGHIWPPSENGYSFWRKTLQGSSMTQLPRHSNAASRRALPTIFERTVSICTAPSGITQASFFTLACATAFSRLAGSRDVVFGRVVTGRAALPASLQNVVGPCLNRLPVRVQFSPDQTKTERLMDLQKQQAEALMHETIGFMDIVKHCTDWPQDTNDFAF